MTVSRDLSGDSDQPEDAGSEGSGAYAEPAARQHPSSPPGASGPAGEFEPASDYGFSEFRATSGLGPPAASGPVTAGTAGTTNTAAPPSTPTAPSGAPSASDLADVRPAASVSDRPQPPPTAHVLDEPRSGVVRNTLITAAAMFGIFLSGLASDLLAGTLSDSPAWAPIERLLNVLSVVILAVLLLVWLVGAYLRRRRPDRQLDSDLVAPGPPIRPAWFRRERVVVGRSETVQKAVDVLLRYGVVAIVGETGTGSSTVAHAVVHELIRQGHADPTWTAPFNLRGWSTERPDDAPTIAGHLLSSFGASEPLSASEQIMDDAATRLLGRLPKTRSVLVLDNVSSVDQVAWLTKRWPSRERFLVVALSHDPTSPALAEGFKQESVVPLTPLDVDDLRVVWREETRRRLSPDPGRDAGTAPHSGAAHADGTPDAGPPHVQEPTEKDAEEPASLLEELWARWEPRLDDVLAECHGRPSAVHDLVREVTRPGADIWHPNDLLDGLEQATKDNRLEQAAGVVNSPVRMRYAILYRTHTSLSRRARRLARALADLPVAELTVEAMEAVRRGLDEAPDSGHRPEPEVTARPYLVDPLQELTTRYLIRQTEAGRYRMPREVRAAVRAIVTDDERNAVRAALPSLLRRYAHLAERWRALLDTRAHAASAARWFQAEEPFLRALVTAEYPDEPRGASDQPLLTLLIDDLATLADALDGWYVRQGQVFGASLVHTSLGELAKRAGRPDLVRLAEARKAAVDRATGQLDIAAIRLAMVGQELAQSDKSVRGTAWALRARLHHERALLHLARAERPHVHPAQADGPGHVERADDGDPLAAAERRAAELREAERQLQHAWAALPKNDDVGEITTLLSMAVVYLHQGVPERALDRLDLAETRAQDADDATALAHVAELRGVAAWMQGRTPVAVALWQRAMTRFSELADHQGEARCLRHLGSAVLVAPELAGLLLGDQQRPLDELTAVRYAYTWLQRAQRLVAGQPESKIGRSYLELARERVGHGSGLPSGDPEVVADDRPARTEASDESERRQGVFRRFFGHLGRRLLL